VRGDVLYRLAKVVVHLEFFFGIFGLLAFGLVGLAGDDDAFVEHEGAGGFADVGVVGDALGEDVARAFEGVVDGGDFELGVDEGCGELERGGGGGCLGPEVVGQGLEAALAGDGGLGAALGLVGEIEVFELGAVERLEDAGLELVGELALLFDGGKDGGAAVGEFAEVG